MINGKDLIVSFQNAGVYYPLGCDMDCQIEITGDFLQTTDPGNPFVIKRLPQDVDWTISGTGLADYTNVVSVLFMQQLLLGNGQIFFKLTAQNVTYSGTGYFQSIVESAKVGDLVTYTYTIVANGALAVTT